MKCNLRRAGFVLTALTVFATVQAGVSQAAPARRSVPMLKERERWVQMKASTNKWRYVAGEPITVRLVATNTAKRGAYLRFTSGQRFDFSIVRRGEYYRPPIYKWSASRSFMAATGSLWLKPGKSQAYEAVIGDEMGKLQPGKYLIYSHLTNQPRNILALPTQFEVLDPGLAVTAKTDKTTYAVGENVHVDVTATNTSGKENIVPFESGMTFDVLISDDAGKQVWTYGALIRFVRVLGTVSWKKGETKEYAADWNGVPFARESGPAVLKPGRYKVQAVLQSTPKVYAEPVYITIR